ncbi:MAG: monothiol bacilliredoxin BrxC family protein [Dehalococcoidia bacterium]
MTDTHPAAPTRRARFLAVEDAEALASLFLAETGPRLVFLHDPWCPISERAYEEMERVDADVHLVDVSGRKGFSQAVQAATGVKHESPQVILVEGGAARWHASHGRITRASVSAALGGGGHPAG